MVSFEQILIRQPQWIISGDNDGKGTDISTYANRPGWSSLPAVRSGNIASVNADTLYRYGPRLADAVLVLSLILFQD
jgi:iron complex transport system substrate-binding protein